MPVFLVQHIKDIVKVCKVICYKCSKLMINKKNFAYVSKLSPEERWQIISNHKITRCGQETEDCCNCKQPDKYK